MKTWHVIIAAGTMTFVASSAAFAACDSFKANIPIDARHFEYSDINGDGKVDPGDMIVGRDTLYDKDGGEIGRLFATVDINDVDDTGDATKFTDTQVYALPKGGIFAYGEVDRGKVDVRDFISESFKDNNLKPTTLQIIGGTGAYAGASGTAVMSFADGVGTIDVSVSCK